MFKTQKRPTPFFFCIISIILGVLCSQMISAEELALPPTNEIVDKTPHIIGQEEANIGERIILKFANVNTDALSYAKIESWPNKNVEILDVYAGWRQSESQLHVTITEPNEHMIAVTYIDTQNDVPTLVALRHIIIIRAGPTPPVPPTPPTPPTPPGPPGPDPPQPPTTGVVYLIMVKPDQPTADQFEQFLRLRTWVDSQPHNKVALWEITKDQQASSGGVDARLSGFINQVPSGEPLPYLFIVQQITGSDNSAILWKGAYNASKYQEVLDKVGQLAP
jgi:hypothetical protein